LQRKAVDRLKHDTGTAWTAGDLAAALGTPDAAEALFKILSHLAANGRITRTGGAGVATQFRG
jgi:alkylated DNA nucleotide flippase Atl1